MISACACIGPVGDCPCDRERKGLPQIIHESFVSKEVFACLPDEDKRTINNLKFKAVSMYLVKRKT